MLQPQKVVTHIVDWLSDYTQKAKTKGFVVGISGGIDSAVVSTLCAKTGYPVICTELPIHQHPTQENLAKEHINWLQNQFSNVLSVHINLTEVFDSFVAKAPVLENKSLVDLSLANTRSRLRMLSLYYLAGINQFLVVGTGNKVEDFGVGFFTKYGDGGVDLSPIADLMKSEVYALAAYLGVSQSIQNAAPSDGLFSDNRSDEDQLGATYDELEWAMKMDALHKTSDDFTGREKEVFMIYKKLNTGNLHKMVPIPVCVIPEEYKK